MPPAHACEACKRRKVRCDGTEPCANCRISDHQCHYKARLARRSPRIPVVGPPQTIPWTLESTSTSIAAVSAEPCFYQDAAQIHSALTVAVRTLLGPESIVDIANGCVDYFVQYLFPNTPVAHEPTLRAAIGLVAPDGLALLTGPSPTPSQEHQVAALRQFTLITALCAFVTSAVPALPVSAMSARAPLSTPFLGASRAMLRVYDAYDLEHPDSTSLTIRMWYSAAMQNTTGRVGASYQYHAEAAFLARRLRLHDEPSMLRYSALETKVLRATFWLLYLADKTSIAFESRPPVLHFGALDGDITLQDGGDEDTMMLDPDNSVNGNGLERRIFVGFHLKRRVWASAADLLLDIKSFLHREVHGGNQSEEERDAALLVLTEQYLLFEGLADQLPDWLRNPDALPVTSDGVLQDEAVAAYQRSCFWAQRSNILTVFHCMRLVILQRCIDGNITSVVGLHGQVMSHAMRKIEIARDFLHEMQIVPFQCFKAQGETAV